MKEQHGELEKKRRTDHLKEQIERVEALESTDGPLTQKLEALRSMLDYSDRE